MSYACIRFERKCEKLCKMCATTIPSYPPLMRVKKTLLAQEIFFLKLKMSELVAFGLPQGL